MNTYFEFLALFWSFANLSKSAGNCKLTNKHKTKKCGKFKLPRFCQKVREIAHWQINKKPKNAGNSNYSKFVSKSISYISCALIYCLHLPTLETSGCKNSTKCYKGRELMGKLKLKSHPLNGTCTTNGLLKRFVCQPFAIQ